MRMVPVLLVRGWDQTYVSVPSGLIGDNPLEGDGLVVFERRLDGVDEDFEACIGNEAAVGPVVPAAPVHRHAQPVLLVGVAATRAEAGDQAAAGTEPVGHPPEHLAMLLP